MKVDRRCDEEQDLWLPMVLMTMLFPSHPLHLPPLLSARCRGCSFCPLAHPPVLEVTDRAIFRQIQAFCVPIVLAIHSVVLVLAETVPLSCRKRIDPTKFLCFDTIRLFDLTGQGPNAGGRRVRRRCLCGHSPHVSWPFGEFAMLAVPVCQSPQHQVAGRMLRFWYRTWAEKAASMLLHSALDPQAGNGMSHERPTPGRKSFCRKHSSCKIRNCSELAWANGRLAVHPHHAVESYVNLL